MTTTYDPSHPAYLDEGDVRGELDRVFDLCHGCRLCFSLCPSFVSLFDLIDGEHDGDATALSKVEQDRVVDECYQCKLCELKCPYTPPHEWQLDFPRLVLRATASRAAQRRGIDVTAQVLGRTDLLGRVGTATAPVTNALLSKPATPVRRVLEALTGIAAERVLPPYARQRFTTWWKRRPHRTPHGADGDVTVFPTCLVEYQAPGVGKDLVHVLERNGVGVDVAEGTVCCGMPWLDAGDVGEFTRQAERNVAVLADAVRRGRDVVVAQPTCGYVLKRDYPGYLGTDDARLVADHTFDAAEHLMNVHRRKDGGLDTDFAGKVPEAVTLHAPCHLRAQNMGSRSADLLRLTGATVSVVEACSGIDGTWGYRAANYDLSRRIAQPLRDAIEAADHDLVAGDCHLANGAIAQETGERPLHPIQVLARAYGIPDG